MTTDTDSHRREALRALIANKFGGVARQMAIAAKKPAGQINDMLSSPPRKSFGEKIARQLEKKLGLEDGYFDRPIMPKKPAENKQDIPLKANQRTSLYDFSPPPIKEVAEIMSELNSDRQQQVVGLAKHLLNEQRLADKNSPQRAAQ